MLILVVILIFIRDAYCTFKPFIVGGVEVDINENPHVAFLLMCCKRTKWICGASILNQRMLVTAAHCLITNCDETDMSTSMEIFAGHENHQLAKVKRTVQETKSHEKFDENVLNDDIALLKLEKNMPLGRNIKRVIIAKTFPSGITHAKVSGWGTIDDKTGLSGVYLKQVSTKLRSKKTCAHMGTLTAGSFCAGSLKNSEEHPSTGDSGSGLIIQSTAIGVVSYRMPQYPALIAYTNLTYYYKWIKRNAKILYCSNKINLKHKIKQTKKSKG